MLPKYGDAGLPYLGIIVGDEEEEGELDQVSAHLILFAALLQHKETGDTRACWGGGGGRSIHFQRQFGLIDRLSNTLELTSFFKPLCSHFEYFWLAQDLIQPPATEQK